MKKLLTILCSAFVLFLFVPVQANAASEPVSTSVPTTSTEALSNRLTEIREMDKSGMSSPEKKALREEKRAIKKQPNSLGGGVYITAGGLLLLIVLLIILL